MKKKVILATTNDISSDNRVNRVAMVLLELGYDVTWVGRELPGSPDLDRPYKTHRFKLWARKGVLFYAFYNLKLFQYLLFRKVDLIISNDLDTLLPCFMISRLRRKDLVYDTHEYFCGVPEIQGRPLVKGIWRTIERSIFPRLDHIITVNSSIAKLYQEEYGKEILIVRNIADPPQDIELITREEVGLPDDEFVFINQGTGINIDRGMEEFLEALPHIPNAHLLLVGSGDVIPALKDRAEKLGLNNRVTFVDRQPYRRLLGYTRLSDAGLSLDKDTNINYRFSLPNKIFDYIQSDIPILASSLLEVRRIVEGEGIGEITPDHSPRSIAEAARKVMERPKGFYRENLERAKKDLTWENEKGTLVALYSGFNH